MDNTQKEIEFFSEKVYLSYSAISKLLYAPQLFYKHYILNQKDDTTSPALLEGKVIHCLLLDNGSFDSQFILLPGNMPSDNPKEVINRVYNEHYLLLPLPEQKDATLDTFSEPILAILKEINLHQSLKTDTQRLEKIVTPSNKEYFDFLIKRKNREIIDIATLDYCTGIVELFKTNNQVKELLNLEATSDSIQAVNELFVKSNLPDHDFGIKGILDNIKIDLSAKKLYINDIKTTSKSLVEFKDTVEYFNLWLQAAIYTMLVRNEYLVANNLAENEWTIEFTFVVVDKYKQIYPFKVSAETLKNWEIKTQDVFKQIKWHFDNRRFDLPHALATSQVLL